MILPLRNPSVIHAVRGCQGRDGHGACIACPTQSRADDYYPEQDYEKSTLSKESILSLASLKPGRYVLDTLGDPFANAVPITEIVTFLKLLKTMHRHEFSFATRFSDRVFQDKYLRNILSDAMNIHIGVRLSYKEDQSLLEDFMTMPIPIKYLHIDPLLDRAVIDGALFHDIQYALVSGDETGQRPGADTTDLFDFLDVLKKIRQKGTPRYLISIGKRNIERLPNSTYLSFLDPAGHNPSHWPEYLQPVAYPWPRIRSAIPK